MASERDLYYVAVKVFLERDGTFFVFRDRFGDWDIPGGRIQRREFDIPLENVIKRKLKEELGSSIRYRLKKPILFMRHERKERGAMARIFAVGYRATLLGGEPKLSEAHTEFLWAPVRSYTPEKYFRGGWLRGVKEYLKIRRATSGR